jgi:hypothetical protein
MSNASVVDTADQLAVAMTAPQCNAVTLVIMTVNALESCSVTDRSCTGLQHKHGTSHPDKARMAIPEPGVQVTNTITYDTE